jgi:hypothetical protein
LPTGPVGNDLPAGVTPHSEHGGSTVAESGGRGEQEENPPGSAPPASVKLTFEEALDLLAGFDDARDVLVQRHHLSVLVQGEHEIQRLNRRLGFDQGGSGAVWTSSEPQRPLGDLTFRPGSSCGFSTSGKFVTRWSTESPTCPRTHPLSIGREGRSANRTQYPIKAQNIAMEPTFDPGAMIERFRRRAEAVRQRGLPPVEGPERQRFREQAQLDYMDFAMLGDATARLDDGVLTLTVDLRPPEARG